MSLVVGEVSLAAPKTLRRIWLQTLALVVAGCVCACSGHGQSAQTGAAQNHSGQAPGAASEGLAAPIFTDHGPNSAAAQAEPYVILVSLDGFRYDYPRKYAAPNISALGARGASAPEGMIPAYPSVTFPNHYTIVTGLYPEHHGIVGNSFYDPARKQVYSYHDPSTEVDGTWYGGTPLWVLAEQQGMRAACFFWPGSEADIPPLGSERQARPGPQTSRVVAESANGQMREEAPPQLEIPPRRDMPKVGRNEACPCGSGKKFKNCCGKAG